MSILSFIITSNQSYRSEGTYVYILGQQLVPLASKHHLDQLKCWYFWISSTPKNQKYTLRNSVKNKINESGNKQMSINWFDDFMALVYQLVTPPRWLNIAIYVQQIISLIRSVTVTGQAGLSVYLFFFEWRSFCLSFRRILGFLRDKLIVSDE